MNSRLFRFDFDRTLRRPRLESSLCPADTLYSALCVEALRMGGQQLASELVACSTLRLTDLPFYGGPITLVPKPLHSVPVRRLKYAEEAGEDRLFRCPTAASSMARPT